MSVQETADGGYIATCSSRADYQAVSDSADFGLLKLDEDGHILWQKEIGGEGGNYPHTVVEQAENAFLIGGTTGFGGGQFDMTLWQVDLDDTLCRCPFYEGSFSTIDSMITTGAEVSVILESFTLNQSPLVITAQPETAVSNLICSTMVEEEITAVIPVSGGTVAASDGHISLVFPSGSFSETVQVTYRHFWDDVATGELAGMGERVGVTAVYSATQQPAQLLPGATVTATIHYTDNSPAIEETLAWYQWQETGWQRADSSQLSLPDETLTAVVEELGQFAVLGETYRVYMPGIPQNSNRQGYRLLLHLDESGNNFADRSGYGHDGQCDGSRCPTVVAGVNQMARHFDGVNDVIQLGYPQTLNLKGEVTLAAWLKPETAVGLQNIIAHGYALNPKAELFLRLNNGNYEVGSWDGSDHLASFAIPPTDIGQWVCLVGVYDGTAWRLYRNGVQVSSTAADTGAVSVHGRWAVGANGEGNGRFFQGSIDEVMVYDHGLTAVELAELYESYLSQ
jgi:hypothetical protein